MNRLLSTLIVSSLLVSLVPSHARAEVIVERKGNENAMQEVAKSVFYGAVAGLLVGAAIAVADNGGNDDDYIRWGFAGGTVLGLGFGIWQVATRPSGAAMLEYRDGNLRAGTFAPTIVPGKGAQMTLFTARF